MSRLTIPLTPDTEYVRVDGNVVIHHDAHDIPFASFPAQWVAVQVDADSRAQEGAKRRRGQAAVIEHIVTEAATSRSALIELRDAADRVLRKSGPIRFSNLDGVPPTESDPT